VPSDLFGARQHLHIFRKQMSIFSFLKYQKKKKSPGKILNVVLEKDVKDQLDDYMRNEEVLLSVKEQRNILHEISKRKNNWIGHI
jgi:hypothetical protein